MLQSIIDEARALEAEAIRSEEDATTAYEAFVKETNASVDAKSKDQINKTEEKAKAEEEKVEAEKQKAETMLQLENLANYKSELHQRCDFTLKNFETRQTARDEEVEALKQAKAILSGAKFEALLQYAPSLVQVGSTQAPEVDVYKMREQVMGAQVFQQKVEQTCQHSEMELSVCEAKAKDALFCQLLTRTKPELAAAHCSSGAAPAKSPALVQLASA